MISDVLSRSKPILLDCNDVKDRCNKNLDLSFEIETPGSAFCPIKMNGTMQGPNISKGIIKKEYWTFFKLPSLSSEHHSIQNLLFYFFFDNSLKVTMFKYG